MRPATTLLAALFALALVASACSSDDSTSTENGDSTETTSSDDSTETAEDATVTITAVSFDSSTVTIRNDGAEELPLGGMFMCNRPAYAGLPDETIAAGETFEIDVTELDIRGSGGEFGLYTSSSFDSADAMVAYVQWGGADNGRSSVAVEAGFIEEGEFVDNGDADFTIE